MTYSLCNDPQHPSLWQVVFSYCLQGIITTKINLDLDFNHFFSLILHLVPKGWLYCSKINYWASTRSIFEGLFTAWQRMNWRDLPQKVTRVIFRNFSSCVLNKSGAFSAKRINFVSWYLPSTAHWWPAGLEGRPCRSPLWPSSRTAFASNQWSSAKPNPSPCRGTKKEKV